MAKSDWKDTDFKKFVRIKEDSLIKIKEIKGQKSIAGKLEEIINYYLKMHNV